MQSGQSSLALAAYKNHAKVVSVLCEAGANMESIDEVSCMTREDVDEYVHSRSIRSPVFICLFPCVLLL